MDIREAHLLIQASEASGGHDTLGILTKFRNGVLITRWPKLGDRVMDWIKANPGVPATHDEIADEADSKREHVTRELRRMTKLGMIRQEQHNGKRSRRSYYPV